MRPAIPKQSLPGKGKGSKGQSSDPWALVSERGSAGAHAGSDYSLTQLIVKEAWDGGGGRVTLERCKEAGLAHTGWTANGHMNQCTPHKRVTLDESEAPISLETHAHTHTHARALAQTNIAHQKIIHPSGDPRRTPG